jgi:hypothetical protein
MRGGSPIDGDLEVEPVTVNDEEGRSEGQRAAVDHARKVFGPEVPERHANPMGVPALLAAPVLNRA